jgi:CRP-like cAMP-binding protein
VPVVCDQDRVLFHQGEAPGGLYILRTGEAHLTLNAPSGEIVLCIQPSVGSLLGLPALVGHEPYSMTAKALKGSEFGLVAHEDFDDLMQTVPSMPLRILHVLASEVRAARQALL